MSQNQSNQLPRSSLIRPVGLTLLATLVGMSVYELVKSMLWPEMTLWESHLVTIVFSGVLAAVTAGVIWRKFVYHQHIEFVQAHLAAARTQILQQTQTELEHQRRLLLSLSQIAQAVQRAHTADEIYRLVGDEAAKLGYNASVFTLTADRAHLQIHYLGHQLALLQAVEKLTGLSQDYCYPLEPGGIYEQLITTGETTFFDPFTPIIAEALPPLLRPLAGQIMTLLNIPQGIIAPLKVNREIMGLLIVSGANLATTDTLTVTTVAYQIAIALENAQLYQSLRESEGKYRLLVETSPDAIITCDLAGRITYVSPHALEMYGSVDLLEKGAFEQIVPEERDRAVANFQKTLNEGSIKNVEYTLQRNDGTLYTGELDVALIKDAQGQPQGFMAIARDITTRKQMEAALRASEERYRTLVESQGEGVGIVDPAERFIFANPAAHQIFGVPPGGLVGRSLQEFTDADSFAALQVQTHLRQGGQASVYETEITRLDGQRRTVLITATPQFDPDGHFIGAFGVFRDITQRKQTEQELQRRVTELSALNTLATIVSQSLDEAEILNRAINEALPVVGIKAAVVYLPNKTTNELVMVAHRGIIADLSRIVSQVKPEITTSWLSTQGGAAKVIQTPAKNAHTLKPHMSVAKVPLIGATGVIGIMYLGASRPECFDVPGLKLLTSLGQQIATGLEKARLYTETHAWAAELDQRVKEKTTDVIASEARYRTLFNSALDALFVMDMQGNYLDANPAACKLVGYSREELLAMNFFQIVDASPEVKARIIKDRPVSWRRGRAGDILRLIHKTGQTFETEASLTPLAYEGQETVLSIVRDITQRAQAEQALRESETRYKIVSELTADYVFILKVETDGQVVIDMMTDNFFTITGRTVEEVKSPDLWAKIFPTPEDYTLVMKSLRTVMASGQSIEIECRTLLKNNELRWVHIFSRPQWDEAQQRVVAIIGAVKDITARKEAEESLKHYSERLEEMVEERTRALQEAQEQLLRREKLAMLGQLAGNVAHELRNPLGAVKNIVYFLNMVLVNPSSEIAQSLEILNKEVDRSDRIISSLLDFARSKQPSYQQVNLNEVVGQTLAQLTTPENIEVIRQLDDTLPLIQADPEQLAQVFNNLLLNAVQSMSPPLGEGGRLVVKTTLEKPLNSADIPPAWAVVAISDTGVGMSPENQAKLFEPLFTTKAKGIGLGLPLVKAFVEGHGGVIEVESKVGAGSTFTVKLPII